MIRLRQEEKLGSKYERSTHLIYLQVLPPFGCWIPRPCSQPQLRLFFLPVTAIVIVVSLFCSCFFQLALVVNVPFHNFLDYSDLLVMAEPSDVPSVSPPLSLVSPTDKGGLIVVMTALAMCFVLVAFVIRLYVRMAVSGFRLDDAVLTLASVQSLTLMTRV